MRTNNNKGTSSGERTRGILPQKELKRPFSCYQPAAKPSAYLWENSWGIPNLAVKFRTNRTIERSGSNRLSRLACKLLPLPMYWIWDRNVRGEIKRILWGLVKFYFRPIFPERAMPR